MTDYKLAGKGGSHFEIEELERIVIELTQNTNTQNTRNTPANSYAGYSVVGNRLNPIPAGSTLDSENGIFYWSPGPGFVGKYRLVFIDNKNKTQRRVEVTILPKYTRQQ